MSDIDGAAVGTPGVPARFVVSVLEREREQFFLWSPVCLGAGIAAYFAMPVEPNVFVAAVPLALMIVFRSVAARGTLASMLLAGLLLAGTGFVIAKLRVEWVRAPVLLKVVRNAEVSGTVVMVEAKTPRGQRLTLRNPVIAGVPPEDTPAVVRIRTMSSRVLASPGDRIRIKANLSPPARPALPGAFDYARTAWFEQVGAVGYAFAPPRIEAHVGTGGLTEWYRRTIEDIRQGIAVRIRAVLPGEQAEIALALITGERGGISAATNDAFRNSGLFHILSISGLHMVIAAGAVFYSMRLILAAVPLFALTLPIKKIAAATGILSALAYLAISGGQFATVRSALMILIIFGAVLIDRPALALRNVALAAFLILAVFPESLLDAGFQMSFAAVTALIASHELLRRLMGTHSRPHPVLRLGTFFAEIVASTLIASLAVAPFAAYNFHQSQQYAVLANMIAIPVCNILVMPGALLAMALMPFGLEVLGLIPMGWGIDGMTWCANYVGALPGAVGHLPEIPLLAFALMVAGGTWLALWRTRLRLLGVGVAIVGVMLAPWMQRPDIIVGQKGTLVAVRDGSGQLSSLPAKNAKYDLARWLEYDGDSRSVTEAQKAEAFTCDSVGCTAHVKGATIAVARHSAAVVDDCLNADVLILATPKPVDCAVPTTVIDVFDRWRNGAYALYLDRQENSPEVQVRFETVAARRGVRPWSPTPERSAERRARLRRTAAPTPAASMPRTTKEGTSEKGGEASAAEKDRRRSAHTNMPSPSAGLYDDPGEAADESEDGDVQ